MSFDASKFQIMPLDKANLAGFIQIAEILEEAPHWSLDAYLGLINRDPSVPRISLVAQDVQAGEVIGFVVACLLPPEAEIESIGVTTSFQRHGVGSRLMEALIRELNRREAKQLFLEVRASNGTALAFYRSLGFVQTGHRPRYYADPVEDAVLMTLRLS